jgi:hypothetical protein
MFQVQFNKIKKAWWNLTETTRLSPSISHRRIEEFEVL